MGKLSLRLLGLLHEQVKVLAQREGVSMDQFVTTALATQEYLEARAARGDRGAFERALAVVPDAEPEAHVLLGRGR